MLHIPLTNILFLAAKQEPYKKAYLLTKNIRRIFRKKFRRMDQKAGKKDRKSNRTRQKNKRGDSKVESNDSPEIPDRGEDITSPASCRGVLVEAPQLLPQLLPPPPPVMSGVGEHSGVGSVLGLQKNITCTD